MTNSADPTQTFGAATLTKGVVPFSLPVLSTELIDPRMLPYKQNVVVS